MSFWAIHVVTLALVVSVPCAAAASDSHVHTEDPFAGAVDVKIRNSLNPNVGVIGNFNLSSYSVRVEKTITVSNAEGSVEKTISVANAEGGLRSVSKSESQRMLDSSPEPPSAVKGSPVAKVIFLIEDLKKQVEEEGKLEAASYDEFACFCNTATEKKGVTIMHNRDAVTELSAGVQEITAKRLETSLSKGELNKKIQQATVSLKAGTVRCEKEQATFEASIAEVGNALTALENAHKALVASKPAEMLLLSVQHTVQKGLALASALNLDGNQQNQDSNAAVSPKDAAYQYHSQGILETIIQLKTSFQKKKDLEDAERTKAKQICDAAKASFSETIKLASDALADADDRMLAFEQQMANAKEGLTHAQGLLKADEVYLKDLTSICESKAREWDQRTHIRAKEVEALAGALAILKDKVAGLDADVNKRAMLLSSSRGRSTKNKSLMPPISFLQDNTSMLSTDAAISRHQVPVLVQAHADAEAGLLKVRQSTAAGWLSQAAGRTHSAALSVLALRVATDPFTEVKALIQKLIERLLREATAEVTKKSFCDEQLSRAVETRDQKFEEMGQLQVDLGNLGAKQTGLATKIDELSESLVQQRAALAKADELREEDVAVNTRAVARAEQGEEAVSEALAILRAFYREAAKSTIELLQASPVDDDTSGTLFSGSYFGKQGASSGIIGILEVVLADFKRTIRMTQQMESRASAEYTEFERTSKVDIAGKATEKELDEQELKSTKAEIEETTAGLMAATREMDDALKALEALQPTCVDTSMSYQERVDKRNEEITALRKALCMLDPEGVEGDKCKNGE